VNWPVTSRRSTTCAVRPNLDQPYGLLLVGALARLTREFGALLEFLRGPDGSMRRSC
jgi:hypothetical protein